MTALTFSHEAAEALAGLLQYQDEQATLRDWFERDGQRWRRRWWLALPRAKRVVVRDLILNDPTLSFEQVYLTTRAVFS